MSDFSTQRLAEVHAEGYEGLIQASCIKGSVVLHEANWGDLCLNF